ncbi:hypothetical protein ABIB80_000252 [Bradyrhizobium sp. i1.15.2]|uniref:hypothetical protein n=1 Tax=Bradyrhizobium sp. i1.15.2 TaxID=3156362 RepID=UPI003392560A
MTVLSVHGETNAAVVVKGLLEENGLPPLTPEGVDALAARFSTGLVLGHGTVSHNGKPLIDELRALYADPESNRLFSQDNDQTTTNKPVGNLTASMTAEVKASRRQVRAPDDWHEVRRRYAADSMTGKMLREREREWR